MIDFETLPWEAHKHSPSNSDLKCEAVEATHKTCQKCFQFKPFSDYYAQRGASRGLQAYCKPCASAQATLSRRRAKTGFSGEDYATRKASQGNLCAVCSASSSGNARDFNADHCHTTGSLRGVLCASDNLALGHLQDDPVRFLKAAAYLVAHGAPMPNLSIFHEELARQRALIASY